MKADKRHLKAMWAEEIAKAGLRNALADRIRFHISMSLEELVDLTGFSLQTIRKHCKALEQQQFTLGYLHGKEWVWRPMGDVYANSGKEPKDQPVRA